MRTLLLASFAVSIWLANDFVNVSGLLYVFIVTITTAVTVLSFENDNKEFPQYARLRWVGVFGFAAMLIVVSTWIINLIGK